MHLSVAIIALLALGLVRDSGAADASLRLPSDIWEDSSTQIKCTSETEDNLDIKEGRFWKVGSSDVYFEYAKLCGAKEFEIVNDTTDRIAFTTSKTVPTWYSLINEDTGSYQCSLVSCLTNETQVSDSVAMTVHKYNTAPTMQQPASSLYGYVNDSVNVTFACEGYTGYPPGNMSVIEERVYSDRRVYRVLYANMTTDESGFAQQSVTLPITFETGLKSRNLYCQTYKAFGSSSNTKKSKSSVVYTDYPPETINYLLTSRNSSDRTFTQDNLSLNLTRTGWYYLACDADSTPVSVVSFRLASEPSSFVTSAGVNAYYIEFYYLNEDLHLQFQCDVQYASTANPAMKFNRTGIVNVFVSRSVSPGNGSGITAVPVSFCSLLMLALSVIFAVLK